MDLSTNFFGETIIDINVRKKHFKDLEKLLEFFNQNETCDIRFVYL